MGRVVNPTESYGMLDRKRRGLLKRMAKLGPLMMATATYLKIRCGNSGCKCASKKEDGHEKLHLSWTDKEGNGTMYVPVNLRKEVLEWVENYQTMREYMKEITLLSRKMIKLYSKTHPRAKKGSGIRT